ncbi:MAG: tripartite tricarboxylate transporter substrate binding protein [Alphaproteobacteria bacterium]|nr:tripartite tricarboxylate transporter substrate binding protein [Alphaproteobacteria bacterium]
MRLKIPLNRLTAAVCAMVVLAGAVVANIASSQAAEWPERPITVVVGFGVGGSADRTARAVASFLPDHLGVPVRVVNRPGAGSQLGATYVLSQPADGNTVFFSAISPYLGTSVLLGNAKYTLDDFAFVNGQWTDWDLIAANKNTPYKTLAELLTAIKENPRKVKVSLTFGSSGHLSTLLLLDAMGIPHENLNMVNYDSGGAARTAVAGGQVDFMILGGEGSEGVRDFIRPLAVIRKSPHPDWDAPPVLDALKPLNIEIPIVLGSIRGMATSAEFKKQHPQRFEKLANAYKAALMDKKVQKFMKRSNIGAEWIGPEETTARIQEMYEVFQKYKSFLKK